MPVFTLKGRVRPEVLPLSIDYKPTFTRHEKHDIPDATYTVEVSEGEVSVKVDVHDETVTSADRVFIPALDFARSLVEVVGLTKGIPYEVVLDEVIQPDGSVQPMVFRDRSLGALCTVIDSPEKFEAIADLAMTDIGLSHAISDLLMSLGRPHYSPISCGRVAEAIVHLVTGGKGAKDWARMREALRVDEAYVKLLTDQSKSHRHGHRVTVEAVVTKELARRAWTLMNRYLALRLLDGEPLREAEYPQLHG